MLKEYTKPVVTRVKLVPAEAVLSVCKVVNEYVTGPSGATCCEELLEPTGNCHVPGS